MRQPHQIAIVTGRIDDNQAIGSPEGIDGLGQRLSSGGLIFDTGIIDSAETKMIWNFEVARDVFGPSASVLDIMRETSLPRVEVDGGNALARLHQGNRDMHCAGGLARPPFFVCD